LSEGPENSISAVRLQIGFNDAKNCRRVVVKGLYGDNQKIVAFLLAFKAKIEDETKKAGTQRSIKKRNSSI